MGRATGLDADARQLILDRGERLDYDSLIVACGAETSYFGKDEWRDVSYGLKTVDDARRLRNRLYGAFEEAERARDPAERERWMTFVIVGGGPTGVELAGEFAVITRYTMKGFFTRTSPAKAKVILLDAGERVTAAFTPRLSKKVAGYLADLGVSVHEGARVTAIDDDGVTVSVGGDERRIDAKTVVWAAGVQAASFASVLAEATGAQSDRGGRVHVQSDLTIPGHPEISAIGDVTSLEGPGGRPFPGLATVAIQQGRHVAKAIRSGLPGATTPFRYFDKGALAVVGRGRAICEIRGLKLSGRPAFATYLSVHMFYLAGGGPGHRLKVLIDWISTRLNQPQNQVIDSDLASVEHLLPGVGAEH
jgi:NADH dehydrogenase